MPQMGVVKSLANDVAKLVRTKTILGLPNAFFTNGYGNLGVGGNTAMRTLALNPCA